MQEYKNKFAAFKAANVVDWETMAREELEGSNPWEKLVHRGDGWSIQPFYDRIEGNKGSPLLPASENIFLGPRTWYSCPLVPADDPKKANETALDHLRQGADGIFFELNDEIKFDILLNGIEWQYCSLNFLAKKNQQGIGDALYHFTKEKKFAAVPLHGAFFGNGVSIPLYQGSFRFSGFQMPVSASPLKEIVDGLTLLVRTLGKDFPERASQVAFSTNVGKDFFLEIAKLRAIRVVWTRVLESTQSKIGTPVFLHAYSQPWIDAAYQPHENMLKGTTAAMAAILGGCDALTVMPEEADNRMMARVARNVSNILREESHLSKVADPVAGSYFIENLTRQLADASWESIRKDIPR